MSQSIYLMYMLSQRGKYTLAFRPAAIISLKVAPSHYQVTLSTLPAPLDLAPKALRSKISRLSLTGKPECAEKLLVIDSFQSVRKKRLF